MKVNVSMLNWIQMEKHEVCVTYAAGHCPMSAVCGFFCICHESLSVEMVVGR